MTHPIIATENMKKFVIYPENELTQKQMHDRLPINGKKGGAR
jgi:hypothetical protein